jgi:cysteine desulfurase
VIYADNAATTKISDIAFVKMLPFLQEQYGNPSSQYSLGRKAKRAVELARQQVASAIGCGTSEITFTSSGSEANSWVLRGVAEAFSRETIHIIASSIEHHSVLNTCQALEAKGISVTYIPVDCRGCISVDDVKAAVKPNTKLVSIMFANNEIGTIQPIMEISRYLRRKGILFHTDAVQAVGHISINISKLQVDFLTASAHKFNGAKGTGILYKCSGLELYPLIFGGGQEHSNRAGTENVAGIVAAGYALEESVSDMLEVTKRLNTMIDVTVARIQDKIPNVRCNGNVENCLPGIVNFGFDGVSGESLMNILDLKGICVSTSSACTSGKDIPSHVLLALGQMEKQAKSAIRISYGRYNNLKEAEAVAAAVCDAHKKIISARDLC